MKATQGHTTARARVLPHIILHDGAEAPPASAAFPEPSAAYHARQAADAVMGELDRFRVGQPLAARLAEALLVSELAKRMALRELEPRPGHGIVAEGGRA
ncbi:MAG TPA: hypothetical protein VMF62_20145 [Acetobacteraceae bacterium]|nr:hypothetical protein [Acetobacteraceae bacterium]